MVGGWALGSTITAQIPPSPCLGEGGKGAQGGTEQDGGGGEKKILTPR